MRYDLLYTSSVQSLNLPCKWSTCQNHENFKLQYSCYPSILYENNGSNSHYVRICTGEPWVSTLVCQNDAISIALGWEIWRRNSKI